MAEEGGDVLTNEKIEKIVEGMQNRVKALSFCRRLVAVLGYSATLMKHCISVLYIDDSESDKESKPDAEEEREKGREKKEKETSLSPTPPLVYPSVAYRTVLDELLPSACVSACFSPCHRLLAVVCEDGTLHVWYIQRRHREVRWDEASQKTVAMWSGRADAFPLPPPSSLCGALGDIPSFTPLLTVNLLAIRDEGSTRNTYQNRSPCGLSRCFFSRTGDVLCVSTYEYIYSFCVARPDVQYGSHSIALRRHEVQSGEKEKTACPSPPPHLSFCCRIHNDTSSPRFCYPDYHTGATFRQGGRVPNWITFESSDTGYTHTKKGKNKEEVKMREGREKSEVAAFKPLSECMCKQYRRCSSVSPFGCGVRITKNRLNKSHAPAFFKSEENDWMGNVSCWSPSGDLIAVGIVPRIREVGMSDHGGDQESGLDGQYLRRDGVINILSRQGASLQYEQCLDLTCGSERKIVSALIFSLAFSPHTDSVLISLHGHRYRRKGLDGPEPGGCFECKYLLVWYNDGAKRGVDHSAVNYSKAQVIQYDLARGGWSPYFLFFTPSLSHLNVFGMDTNEVWKYKYARGEKERTEEVEKWRRIPTISTRLLELSTPSPFRLVHPSSFFPSSSLSS